MLPMWPRSWAVNTTPTPWISRRLDPLAAPVGRDLGIVGLDPLIEASQIHQQVTGEVTSARVVRRDAGRGPVCLTHGSGESRHVLHDQLGGPGMARQSTTGDAFGMK